MKYAITPLDFDIMLYISEQEMTTKYEILNKVSNSKGSVQTAMAYLHKQGLIKATRKHQVGSNGYPSGWIVTGKGRNIITEFYMNMFPDIFS
jgi:predicted transcriptional regulator